jgi:hypothetical protein
MKINFNFIKYNKNDFRKTRKPSNKLKGINDYVCYEAPTCRLLTN